MRRCRKGVTRAVRRVRRVLRGRREPATRPAARRSVSVWGHWGAAAAPTSAVAAVAARPPRPSWRCDPCRRGSRPRCGLRRAAPRSKTG
eukprot:scaffold18865_cov57-Phaeocystis_antarctica.AAC.4